MTRQRTETIFLSKLAFFHNETGEALKTLAKRDKNLTDRLLFQPKKAKLINNIRKFVR